MALTKISTDGVKDDAVTLAKQAGGTDGQIITYDASGNPVAVGPGTDGQVLTSTGAGSPPAFEDVPAGGISDVVSDTSPQLGGNLDTNGNDIDFADNVKATFGASEDLLIKHSGTNSEIYHNGEGHFYIAAQGSSEMLLLSAAADIRLSNSVSGDMYLKAISDGAVELYHDGTKQCETSANGLAFPSGKGIDFGATSDASGMTSEVLDEYEEGTFSFTVASGGFSSVTGTGTYTRIGRVVNFQGDFTLNGSGNSDVLKLDGLPFAANSWVACSGYTQVYNNEGSQQASFAVRGNTNDISVVEFGSEMAGNGFNAGYMNVAGCYQT